MRHLLLAILLFNLVNAKPCESATRPRPYIDVVDVTRDFWRFWDATIEDTDDQRVQAFFNTVVASHPELFSGGVLGNASLTNRWDDPKVRQRVATYLREVAHYIPQMRSLSREIARFHRYAKEFEDIFPDFVPTAPVYFTVSLFTFDAGARFAGSGVALLFSIDGIAFFDGPDANLKIIIDHELFHQYHSQIASEESPDHTEALWAYLWEEGLATFISQRLNPGSSAAQVLITPSNLSQLTRPIFPSLARELLDNFESTNQVELAAFFALDNHRPDVPIRSGYYVGYQIAKKLASNRSLKELAALRGPELKAAVRQALIDFAGER
jgi:Putative zinc dependent peptidase (DUF5700)